MNRNREAVFNTGREPTVRNASPARNALSQGDLGSMSGMIVNNPAPNASPSREPAGTYLITNAVKR